MAIYYGVVRGNRIELENGARLAEGTRVEVHLESDDTAMHADEKALIRRLRAEGLIEEPPADDGEEDEEVVKARLRAAGLLAPVPVADDGDERDEDEEFQPVVVQGEPLSEQIIRERR